VICNVSFFPGVSVVLCELCRMTIMCCVLCTVRWVVLLLFDMCCVKSVGCHSSCVAVCRPVCYKLGVVYCVLCEVNYVLRVPCCVLCGVFRLFALGHVH